ncbi:hypothetical protein ACOMHN_002146 [Nucella lapillus]
MPKGLRHILFHAGKTRKEVYRSLWGSLMYIGKLKTGGKRTLVYPEEVRDAVRHRFNDDPDAGAYDRQYLDQGYHVSMEELANCPYRAAPLKCSKCTA